MARHFINTGHISYSQLNDNTPKQKEIRMLSLEELEEHLKKTRGIIVNEKVFRRELKKLQEEKKHTNKE
ncbi:MAG: hypothetical protein ACFE88_08565 [Candidatus Hermodarchaeota archaeon]